MAVKFHGVSDMNSAGIVMDPSKTSSVIDDMVVEQSCRHA